MSEKAVIVVTPDAIRGAALASGIARSGARVALVCEGNVELRDVTSVSCLFNSKQALVSSFVRSESHIGFADTVVFGAIQESALSSFSLDKMQVEDWHKATRNILKLTVFALQASFEYFGRRGASGNIVLFGPSIGLVGANGRVPLCTALEGQRALMKSAARQWGRYGLRLNWLSIGSDSNYPELRVGSPPQVPELGFPPSPLGRVPVLGADVADLVSALSQSSCSSLTGATLNVDGGDWMIP